MSHCVDTLKSKYNTCGRISAQMHLSDKNLLYLALSGPFLHFIILKLEGLINRSLMRAQILRPESSLRKIKEVKFQGRLSVTLVF